MTVAEMISRKKEYGYSNKYIAEISGVPLGTVQKIFAGSTSAPRRQTVEALSKVFYAEEAKPDKCYYSKEDSWRDDMKVMEYGEYNIGTSAEDMSGKTIADYLALPEGTRIEMIDGIFYDMAAPTFIHQRIAAMIFTAFENFVNENGGPCIPSIAPTDVQLECDDKTMIQPDVLVVCDRDKIIKARVVGAPDLIVEVLSPSNWYMDIIRKKKKYEHAGVREYWIVLPEQKQVLVYNFEQSSECVEYSFDEKVPVAIWDGRLMVDFKFIYEKISFLYE